MSYGLDLGSSHATLSSFTLDEQGTPRFHTHATTPAVVTYFSDGRAPITGKGVTPSIHRKLAGTTISDALGLARGGGGGSGHRQLGPARVACGRVGGCYLLPIGQEGMLVGVEEAAAMVVNQTLAAAELPVEDMEALTVTVSGEATAAAAAQVSEPRVMRCADCGEGDAVPRN